MEEAVQQEAEAAVRDFQTEMPRGDAFEGVGFVEDDEIVVEEIAALFLYPPRNRRGN